MFRQLTSWFMNLKFRSKLLMGFGIIMTLSFIIGAAALLTAAVINNRENDANTASEQAKLASEIRQEIQAARDEEAGYFLNYETLGPDAAYTRYAVANQTHVNRVLDLIGEARHEHETGKAQDQAVARLLVLAEDQARSYQNAFNSAVTATQTLGVNETGLTGQLRADAESLQQSTVFVDPTMQITLLEMRHHVLTYLVWGAQADIDGAHEYNARLQDQINALDIPEDQKIEALALVSDYITTFDAVVDSERGLATEVSNLGLFSDNINQLVSEVASEEETVRDSALHGLRTITNLAGVVNGVAVALVFLIGLGLVMLLVRLLTRQVREIDRVLSDVRVGEFASRAQVFGRDEMGLVADGVNGLLQQLTELLGEAQHHLDKRVKELTALHETSRLLQDEEQVDLLNQIVNLIPPAYQYVDIAAARFVYGDQEVATPGFVDTPWKQSVSFTTSNGTMGLIEVVYLEERPEEAEGPFLAEERDLLDSMADQLRAFANRLQADIERDRLLHEMSRQKALLENINDFAAIADLQAHALYVNPAGMEMVGRANEDFTQLDVPDFYPPEERERIAGYLAIAREKGIWSGETALLHADGTEIPVQESIVVIWDKVGELQAFGTICHDLRDQKRTVDEISRQKALLDNIDAFAAISDLEGNYLYVNPAGMEMLGWANEDFSQLSVHDFHPPQESDSLLGERRSAVLEKGIWSGETIFTHKDGTIIPVQESIVLITNKVGEPQAVGSVGLDLRSQKRIVRDVEIATAQVTEASTEMTGIVQLMVEQASNSAQVAEQASSRAKEGDRAVSETIAAMTRIRDNTQETAQRIKRLGEVSQEIGEAVRLIEEVADRTTVLALNASIQAAVAGEAGRGFAVVAEEVQRLAERASGATRKIEDLIKNIQAETNQAVIGVEEATREVVDGSQLALQAGERMAELNELVAQLADLIQQVVHSTASQTSTSMDSLVQLSRGLQESVAAFGTVETVGGNGYQSHHPANNRN
jgi:PAS domain S-box-containing protein